jgi:hippurate hydrolase
MLAMPTGRGNVRVIEMNEKAHIPTQQMFSNLRTLVPDLESVYKDIHSHPELSMQEQRAAGIAADRLRAAGYV